MKGRRDSELFLVGPRYREEIGTVAETFEKLTGLNVARVSWSQPDELELIEQFEAAFGRSKLLSVLADDAQQGLVRRAVSKFLSLPLVLNEDLLTEMETDSQSHGAVLSGRQIKKAFFPKDAEIIKADQVGNCGFLVSRDQSHLLILPGLEGIARSLSRSSICDIFNLGGTGELRTASYLIVKSKGDPRDRLDGFEETCRQVDITVKERLYDWVISLIARSSATHEARLSLEEAGLFIRERLGDDVYGVGRQRIEEVVGSLISLRGWRLAVAESCTGGRLANAITDVAGSSRYFVQGLVTYSNESKIRMLGVSSEEITDHGAVSRETARAMARGLMDSTTVDAVLATTGVAGPGGGTAEKPVGLVYIALSTRETAAKPTVVRFEFSGTRTEIKEQTVFHALDLLRRRLLE